MGTRWYSKVIAPSAFSSVMSVWLWTNYREKWSIWRKPEKISGKGTIPIQRASALYRKGRRKENILIKSTLIYTLEHDVTPPSSHTEMPFSIYVILEPAHEQAVLLLWVLSYALPSSIIHSSSSQRTGTPFIAKKLVLDNKSTDALLYVCLTARSLQPMHFQQITSNLAFFGALVFCMNLFPHEKM